MVLASLGLAAALVLAAEPSEPSEDDTALQKAIERPEPLLFELAARVELRSGQPEGTTPGSSLTDMEIDPVVGLRGPLRIGTIAFVYDPRIFIIIKHPAETTQKVGYLHRAGLVLDTHPSPLWRFYIDARGAYGEYDFLPLSTVIPQSGGTGLPPEQPTTPTSPPTAPNPTPGVSTLPTERFLNVIDINANAGVVVTISPRLSWLASAGYVYSGGSDIAARQFLPLQKGPKGITGGLWSVTRNDNLSFLLETYVSRFSSGPQSVVGSLTTTWSHIWSREVATDLIGGVGGLHSDIPAANGNPARIEDKVLPVGGFSLRHTWLTRGAAWRNSVTFLAAPLPDQINGQIYERLSGVLRSTLAPSEHLSFEVSGGASASIGVEQRDARVEARMTYYFMPHVGISAGARAAWLEGSPLLPTGFGWLGFVAIGAYAGSPIGGALF
jgi:hypothetical protein